MQREKGTLLGVTGQECGTSHLSSWGTVTATASGHLHSCHLGELGDGTKGLPWIRC